VQRDSADKDLVIVADKRLIKVASLEKRGTNNIVKPVWIQDCITQSEADGSAMPYLLPFEPNRHMHYLLEDDQLDFEKSVDENGDSYARDIKDVEEMRKLLDDMPAPRGRFKREEFLEQLEDHGESFSHLKTHMFSTVRAACADDGKDPGWALRAQLAKNYIRFGGGQVVGKEEDGVTHLIVPEGQTSSRIQRISGLARTVGLGWVEKCWEEGTRVDEERFQWG
jgi:DNA ligase-4